MARPSAQVFNFNQFALERYKQRQAAGDVEVLRHDSPLLAYAKAHGTEVMDIDWFNDQLEAMPQDKCDALGEVGRAVVRCLPGEVTELRAFSVLYRLLRMAERTGLLSTWKSGGDGDE
jgi:hypothetical protein